MEQVKVYRKELKYRMALPEFALLERKLAMALTRDGYAKEGGAYTVRSLYLDTPYQSDFYATRQGDELRKKFRLRCYSPGDSFVKLERKAKYGQDQTKTSLSLSRQQAEKMMEGEYGFLAELENAFARAVYTELCQGGYRPQLMLEYNRTAFVVPTNHIRITFDSNIRYTKTDLNLFETAPAMLPLIAAGGGVLEVKYDGFLFTYIRELLHEVDKLPTAFGKYVMACQLAG